MVENERLISLQIPLNVWIEKHDDEDQSLCCDVIVEMDDGTIYTALFVTLAYIRRQMELSFAMTQQVPDTVPVRYAALDTSHVVVEELTRDVIEDTIDNLLALEVFESVFIRVTEDEPAETETTRTTTSGKLATQEIAAVVISDVLVVEG